MIAVEAVWLLGLAVFVSIGLAELVSRKIGGGDHEEL